MVGVVELVWGRCHLDVLVDSEQVHCLFAGVSLVVEGLPHCPLLEET